MASRAAPPGVRSLEPSVFARQAVQAPVFSAPREERPADRPVPRFDSWAVPVVTPPRPPRPARVPLPTAAPTPPAPRAEARHSVAPEGTRPASIPLEEGTLSHSPVRTWLPETRSAAPVEPQQRPAVASPWSQAPAMKLRRAPQQEVPEELDALLTRSWPPLAAEAEVKRAPAPRMDSEPLEARGSGPWPELPEAPPSESAEAQAALRQWERLSRLDREQRGE
jgi:hypothetical protein